MERCYNPYTNPVLIILHLSNTFGILLRFFNECKSKRQLW